MQLSSRPLAAALLLSALTLSACTDNAPSSTGDTTTADPRSLTVTADDSECAVSAASVPAGTLTFEVTNNGSKVTEFYLLGEDGLRILGEVENIGPGLTRDLVLNATEGAYFTACKPGMVGEGIRNGFTITPSDDRPKVAADDRELLDKANEQYSLYVKDQTEQLLTKTEEFAKLYKDGDDDAARELYPRARVHWERIETIAESFGDLDPRMDAREADLEEGQKWTGWHKMEKDLWPARAKGYKPLTDAERTKLADLLVADTKTLYERTRDMEFSADEIANGSKGLLDEVATGKVTGEEEYWSRTDLWDFQANVDGAKVGFEGLRPVLTKRDAELETKIDTRFTELQELLDQHRKGEDGFKGYDELTQNEIKKLSDAVNALSEPLSKLTAAVV